MELEVFLSLFTFIIIEWSVHVTSLSGPEFIKMPPEIKTFTNNTGTVIECLARGDPKPSVTWMGLNQIMVHNIPSLRTVWPNGTLVIEPFNAAQYRVDIHATTYQCKVSNSIGTILAPPTSLRAVVVQELEVQLYDEYVTSGNSVILTCVIPSFLRDLVTVTSWERDSTIHIYPSLHGDGKFHVISDGRLLVHNVQTTDSRQTFRCRVLHTLTGSSAVSNVARIIVNDPHERRLPRMITKDESIITNGESPLIVPCVAQGHPTPKYRWFLRSNLQAEPISLEGKHSILEGMKLHIEKGVLIVPSFTREMMTVDSFAFVCEAFSEDGSSTMEVRVMKSIILRVSVTPKLLIVDSGSSGELHCNIEGYSNGAVVSWYKNGNILPPSERVSFKDDGKLLEIRSVGTGDAGMFQCFVKLGTKVTQSSAELRLGASPPQFIYRFIQQTLTTGPSVSLKCIAKGSPTPVFDWFLDGFPLSHHHRVLVGQYVTLNGEVVSHVNISRSKVIDGGEYTCKAQNSVGSVTHSAPLHIYGPPHIRNMGTITTISGESFKVKCPVAGYPIASIKWKKGGRDLPLNKRHRTSGAVLEIDDVSKEYDEGDYLCVATDKHGRKASQTMSVKVVEKLKVAPFSIPKTLAAGSRMAVQCLVIQGDVPINMEWYHNGKKATLTPGITVTSLGEFVLTLLINKVEPHHGGNYTCRATSASAESSAEHSAFLHVHVAPYWKEDPKDVEVVKGKDAHLACLSEGYPVPKVTWRKTSQGNLYSQNLFHDTSRKTQRQEYFSNGTLLIREITEADEGTYLCEVSNQVGKGLSAIITLKVHAPPHVQSKEKIEARRGESVDLQCYASGDPPLSLTFSKDGHPVDPANVRYKNTRPAINKFSSVNQESEKSVEEKVAEYHLKRVTPLDSGKYVCTATNPYGSQTFVTQLIVEDAPKIPLNLRSTEESSRSVVLKWSGQESDQLSVSYYLLLVTKIEENETEEPLKNLREIKISSDKRSYRLEKLHPHSSYQIKLVAVNSVGQSPPSEPLTITTDGEPPSEPPVNVRATPLSPRAVKVEWTVPDSQSWHGKLLGYYVAYRRKGEKDYLYEVARPSHGKSAEMIISGLERYTTYVFAVKAFNSHGQGKLSAETFARTHEDIPHEAPSDLGCLPLTSSRIELTWSPPSQNFANGEIMSYTVFYIPILSGSYILKSQVTSSPRVALGGLLPYTNYSVSVAASTRAGLGVPSPPLLCLTEEDVPESPASIKSVVSGPTSVVVSWSPPKHSNGDLTKYTLFFQPFKERKPKRRTVPPQTKWLEVTGLTEGREVTLWMTASTRVGESGPTRRVTVIPTKAVPASINLVGSVIKAGLGKDVLFPCPHSGYPQPTLSWRVNGITFPSPHLNMRRQNWEKQTDGSFLIRDLKLEDEGNFTCHVSNYHGSDEVTYYLQVSAPPSAYRIHAVSLSSDSFKISWEKNNLKTSELNKMILTWKKGTGEWREVSLPWYLNTYTLCKLSCGTEYQLYVTAYNDVGAGEASSILTMRTKGNRPNSPPKEKVLYTNITTASLQLSPFSDSECPVKEYYIRLKSPFTHHWLIESGRLPGNYREYVLPNLNEKTKYTVEISAKNEAGESKTVYSFYTSPFNQDEVYEVFGGELSVPSWNSEEDLYTDPAFIIPVIISCLALVVITGAIGICCLRRPVPNSSATLKRNEKLVEIPNWNDQALYGTLRKVPPLPLINNDSKSMGSSSEYTDGEIHPYSTFQLKTYEDLTMSQSVSSSVQTYGRAPLHIKTCQNANHEKIQETQNTRIRPRSLSRGSDYARGRHLSSDDYENWYTDSDADTLPSSKASGYARSTYQHSGGRSAHHNKLYVASDVSALNSPDKEGKSIDRKQKGR